MVNAISRALINFPPFLSLSLSLSLSLFLCLSRCDTTLKRSHCNSHASNQSDRDSRGNFSLKKMHDGICLNWTNLYLKKEEEEEDLLPSFPDKSWKRCFIFLRLRTVLLQSRASTCALLCNCSQWQMFGSCEFVGVKVGGNWVGGKKNAVAISNKGNCADINRNCLGTKILILCYFDLLFCY